MLGGDERTGLGPFVEAVAEADRVGPSGDLVDDPIVDGLLDEEPAAGGADLARVEERAGDDVVDRGVEVGVGEDDVGALAAELEGDLLHVDRGAAEQGPPGLDAAGQRDQVDVRAVRQRLADPAAGPENEVDDAFRNAGFLQEMGQADRRQWCHVGRLHDDGVAGRERRGDLPAHLEEWIVPRPDEPAHADRLVNDPAPDVRVAGVDCPLGLLAGEPGVVAEDAGHVAHIPATLTHRLARVQRLLAGDRLEVAIEEAGDPLQEFAALARRRRRPCPYVEGPPGGPDRGLHLLVRRDVDLRDDCGVRRIDDLAAFPGGAGNPGAVDEEARHGDLGAWWLGEALRMRGARSAGQPVVASIAPPALHRLNARRSVGPRRGQARRPSTGWTFPYVGRAPRGSAAQRTAFAITRRTFGSK